MMMRPVAAVLCLFLSVSATTLLAAPGDLDTTFTGESAPECGPDARLAGLQREPGGALYLMCSGMSAAAPFPAPLTYETVVVRFRHNGTRDPNWGAAGIARVTDGTYPCTSESGCQSLGGWAARDGGFWIMYSNGRLVRLTPRGTVATGAITSLKGNTESPPFDYWAQDNVMGIAERADGGLVVLRREFGYPITKYFVRKLDSSGHVTSETAYDRNIMPSENRLYAWSLIGDTLEMSFNQTSTPGYFADQGVYAAFSTEPFQLFSLTPDLISKPVFGRAMPAAGDVRQFSKEFFLLGDGSVVSAIPNGVAKWRADGSVESDFGLTPQSGYRVASNRVPESCGQRSPFWLNAGGTISITGFWRFSTFISGPSCEEPFLASVSANGRTDTFAQRSPLNQVLYSRPVVDRQGGFILYDSSVRKLVRYQGGAPRADVDVIEFHNRNLDHYFMTAHTQEVADLDNASSQGWQRTGERFGAFDIDTPMPGATPVCRFYGDPVAGPNSHFYSAQAFECDTLRTQEAATRIGNRAWRFERDAFRITVPVDGKCPANLVPVYRVYNRAGPGKDPNHRYVTSTALYDAMQAKGWAGEGIHMCATRN